MRIKNKTVYRTRDLAAFVTRAAKDVFMPDEWARVRRHLHVTVRYTRDGGCSGYAYIRGSHMTVRLDNPAPRFWRNGEPKKPLVVDRIDFAHVCAHELGHILGLQHKDMRQAPKWRRTGNWRTLYAWGETLPLRVKEEKPKLAPADRLEARRAEKIAATEAAIVRWTRKSKLAATKLKLYKRRLAGYARAAEKRTLTSRSADGIDGVEGTS